MIRILIFILSIVFIAALLTVLAGADGRTTAEAFGLKFDIHTGGAAIIVLLVIGAAIILTGVYKDLRRLPHDLKIREREAARERGVAALTRGLEAVAVGDAESAQHHARVARRSLPDSSLTRLLAAQAAHLAGDDGAAKDSFTAMLEAPETEFLGLRGLFHHAMRAGDKDAAKGYAERAFRLRANAAWAFESVLDLGLERGAWGETRAAVKTALKNKVIDAAKAGRAEAALLTADAYAAEASGDTGQALSEAEAALKLAPSLAPAAVLAARLLNAAGRRGRASKLLEQAFADNPMAAIIHAHNALFTEESDEKRAEEMQRIADRNPSARQAKLQLARRHLLLGEARAARLALEPLLEEAAFADDCAMMAEAIQGEQRAADGKPESAGERARYWLRRAAHAPRDPSPGADGEFHFTREGWARLVREYMEHGRLAPPPLEEAPAGVSADEIRRLAAPEPVEAIEPPAAPDIEPRSENPQADDADDDASSAARIIAAAGKVS